MSENNYHDKQQRLILERWATRKLNPTSAIFVLTDNFPCGHEYERRTHSSSYAFVDFQCTPSEFFNFTSIAEWPTTLSKNYISAVENRILLAVIDSLFCNFYPYAGCDVVLLRIKWDDVRSSEYSFYEATTAAMRTLKEEASWRRAVRSNTSIAPSLDKPI